MTGDDLRTLQGRTVSVALADRSRLDSAVLEGVVGEDQLWLHLSGEDVLLPLGEVLAVWEG